LGPLPVEDGSHSTDQPGGKVQGQVKLAIWSSKLIPEKDFNSKAEYTNTQQGLTVNGYTKPTLARLCRVLRGSGFLC
jgi:hypothetical protein